MKYRKLPVIIDAEVYHEGLEDGFDGYEKKLKDCEWGLNYIKSKPYINTLEGKHYITPGDYIITGVKGERYPCKAGIFAMTYEKAEERE